MLRTHYLNHIEKSFSKPFIKVLIGMRRVGKTTILKQLKEHFDWNKPILINFELLEYKHLWEMETLYNYLTDTIEQGSNAIFLDEIQRVQDREKVVNSLHTKYPQVQLIITGSNSSMLSTELSTFLRWRYIEFEIYPFSYDEFCEYHAFAKESASFQDYLRQWGLPSTYHFPMEERASHVMQIMNTIFFKDIVEKHGIKDARLLEEVFYFLLQNTGNITNANKLANHLKNKWLVTNQNTVYTYMWYLVDALTLYEVPLYDVQGKTLFERQKKWYSVDHGMRHLLFSWFDTGLGKELENIVYIEARRRGWEVYVWRIGKHEVDFVLTKGTQKKYIQVAYLLADEAVIQREFTPLEKIHDAFPKYVVSLDPLVYSHPWGIQHIQAWEIGKVFE